LIEIFASNKKLNPGRKAPETMINRRLTVLCLFLFAFVAIASAQSGDDSPRRNGPAAAAPALVLPPVVISGLDGYKAKGAEEAVRLWVKDSPLEGSKDAASQVFALRQIEELYGAYQWFEVVRIREVSPRILTIYLVLDYERGPLFARFTVYRSNHRWIMTSFDFNTREETIFPVVY
jgi:hypothetical protein